MTPKTNNDIEFDSTQELEMDEDTKLCQRYLQKGFGQKRTPGDENPSGVFCSFVSNREQYDKTLY